MDAEEARRLARSDQLEMKGYVMMYAGAGVEFTMFMKFWAR